MKALSLASVVVVLAVSLHAGSASAQTVCPAADEGSACDGGTCIPATCMTATDDGGTATSNCDLCVEVGPDQCLASDDGNACGDGGTCMANSGGGGGAGAGGGGGGSSPVEAGTLTGFMYGIGSCVVPFDAGPGGGVDGAALANGGDDASSGDDASADDDDAGSTKGAGSEHTKDAGLPTATSPNDATGGGSGGCGVAASSPASGLFAIGFAGLGLVFLRRRRDRQG
jgi:MYXO-CTERM domain-containing protein